MVNTSQFQESKTPQGLVLDLWKQAFRFLKPD
jgi:hypothetical protein